MRNGICVIGSELQEKYDTLCGIIFSYKKILLAFSGGVDSSLLLKVSDTVLDGNVIAVTAHAPFHSRNDLCRAQGLAEKLNIEHILIDVDPLNDKKILNNDKLRCYYCKKILFGELCNIARTRSIEYVIEGTNADDPPDDRPGMKALEELCIKSPLKDAGLTKNDVRGLAKAMGLSVWDAASESCFLTRFPFDRKVDTRLFPKLAQAEDIVKKYGFNDVRVRVGEGCFRIEVSQDQMEQVLNKDVADDIINILYDLGMENVTFDPEGYRCGNMGKIADNIH